MQSKDMLNQVKKMQEEKFLDGIFLGLALEDKALRCVTTEVKKDKIYLVDDRQIYLEPPAEISRISLMKMMLSALPKILPRTQSKFKAIGVSTPGMVNTETKTLIDIPRPYRNPGPVTYLLPFKKLLGEYVENPEIDIIVDNDATMSALGERWFRNNHGKTGDFAYIRAGSGINAAAFIYGRPWHGTFHPEMGHMLVNRHPEDPDHKNNYPYDCEIHGGSCLEGRIGSRRLGLIAKDMGYLEADNLSAHYAAQLCHTIALMIAPPEILLSGRTFHNCTNPNELLSKIRKNFRFFMNDYPRNSYFRNEYYIKHADLQVTEASWRGALCAALDKNHPQRMNKGNQYV